MLKGRAAQARCSEVQVLESTRVWKYLSSERKAKTLRWRRRTREEELGKGNFPRESGRKDPKGRGEPKVERGEGKPISLLADQARRL